jgi:hypothetical protein
MPQQRGRSGFDHSRINEAVATGSPVPLITRALSDDDVFGGFIQTPYAFGFFGHLMPTGSTILDGTLIPHGALGDPDPAAIHGNYPPDFVDVIDPAIEARAVFIGPVPNPANNRLLALQHYKGLLNDGHVNALRSKLENAERQAAEGHIAAAEGLLNSFINQVLSLVASGEIPSADGEALVAHARAILAGLGV